MARLTRFWLPLAGLLAVTIRGGAQHAAPPLPPVAKAARGSHVAVLVWHDVLPEKQVWFDTTLRDFERQMAEIKRRKFAVVTLDALRRHLVNGTPLPPRALVLTFDDNGLGLYKHAYPVLKRHGFPAALFVHTDYVGVKTGKDHCTWAQLAEMQRGGLVTVQSLTRSHPPDLRALPDARLDHELRGSRDEIARRLGTPPYALAYTEGKADARTARAARRNGYALAFTEDWGNAAASRSRLLLHRYSILRRFKQSLDDTDRARRMR